MRLEMKGFGTEENGITNNNITNKEEAQIDQGAFSINHRAPLGRSSGQGAVPTEGWLSFG